jgi:hypothetical protein
VQEDREAATFAWRRRVHAEQPDTVAAVDDLAAGSREQPARPAPQDRLPQRPSREQRLDVPVAQA